MIECFGASFELAGLHRTDLQKTVDKFLVI